MSRRTAIITVAVVAVCMATASIAEAAGRRRAGVKGRPSTPTTTRTVVNSTSKSWYTYVYSGTGAVAQTVSAANAQGAKVIAPGGKAVFNVLPNGGGNQFGTDYVQITSVPPLDVNNPNAGLGASQGWPEGTFNDTDYPVLKAGQAMTITITQSSPSSPPEFNPPAP